MQIITLFHLIHMRFTCPEDNNLIGVIPNEIGSLVNLEFWGMERGGLMSTIPSTISSLTQLYFLDLDFNQLTGKANLFKYIYFSHQI